MILLSAILDGVGLSQADAADFLGVRLDSVKSWSSGRRSIPEGVWSELHKLAASQERAAKQLAAAAKPAIKTGSEIELGLASTPEEAQSLGWPSPGAQLAVFRRAWEILGPAARIAIVPRGSTESSRAAIKARQSVN